MAGLRIDQLPSPPRRLRVDRTNWEGCDKFETIEDTRTESLRRATFLRRAARGGKLTPSDARRAVKLASKLEGERFPKSMASPRYMRLQRIRIVGGLWKLVSETGTTPKAMITVIPTGWSFTDDELATVDPRKLMRAFRSTLNRLSARNRSGWMVGFIHCDFDIRLGRFQLHLHIIASGDMIDLLCGLRGLARYKPTFPDPGGPCKRVVVQKLFNVPAPLTYILKSYWPEVVSFMGTKGTLRRNLTKRRMAEPQHSQSLLWMNGWRIGDISLLLGIRPSRAGLTLTK